MHKAGVVQENNTSQELAEYVEKVRKVPRIRSFFWLLRCADALNKLADMEVGMKGDNRTGLAVLQMLLQYPGGISQQSLAKKTGRTKQAVAVAIDSLEKKDYVVRCSKQNDRRVNSIQITSKGVEHLSEVFPHTVDMCNKALSSLSEEETNQLLTLVKKLTKDMWQKIESQSSDSSS